MSEIIIRFLVGGLVVSAFALAGTVLKPTTFAGLFAAAPSVALATLSLAILKNGRPYAAVECRSMMLGAAALGAYSLLVCQLLARTRSSPVRITFGASAAWLLVSFTLWRILLRQ